jgi:hypothetical protein
MVGFNMLEPSGSWRPIRVGSPINRGAYPRPLPINETSSFHHNTITRQGNGAMTDNYRVVPYNRHFAYSPPATAQAASQRQALPHQIAEPTACCCTYTYSQQLLYSPMNQCRLYLSSLSSWCEILNLIKDAASVAPPPYPGD